MLNTFMNEGGGGGGGVKNQKSQLQNFFVSPEGKLALLFKRKFYLYSSF